MTGLLCVLGAGVGAVAAVTLTFLGNAILAAIHGPGTIVYRWNIGSFAVAGAIASPILAWSVLRRVALWRVVLEPAIAAVAATAITMVAAPPVFGLLIPAAVLGAVARLRYVSESSSTQALPVADRA